MIKEILILILITFLPFIELRLSIPVGILAGTMSLPLGITISGLGLNPFLVFFIAVISNIILGILIFNLIFIFDNRLRNSIFKKTYTKFMNRSHRKLKPFVEKYGILGAAVFIGLPIPGSGVYSGSLGSFIIGLNKKQFYLANIIGVIIAGTIVTVLTLTRMFLF